MSVPTKRFFTALALAVAVVLSMPDPAPAGDDARAAVAAAITETRREIEEVSAALAEQRKRNEARRVELSERLAEMEDRVLALRRQAEQHLRHEDGVDVRLAALRERDGELTERVESILPMLTDGRRALDARSDIVEASVSGREMDAVDAALARARNKDEAIPDAARVLLEEMLRRLRRNSRIHILDGRAVMSDGTEAAGRFLRIGAAQTFFLPDEETLSPGMAHLEHGSSSPHVRPLSTEGLRTSLVALASAREASLPLDATGGGALRVVASDRTPAELFRAGGPVMWPILAVGVFGMMVGLWKLLRLVRVSTRFDAPLDRVVRLLLEGKEAEARAFAESRKAPIRRLLVEALEHRRASREDLEEMLHEAVIMEVPPLEKHLTILSVGAAVAPLLGLLGTVTGMISTFRLIAVFGTGDPRMLSGGISEALITTEAGLAVAIPLLLLHAFLTRRVNAIAEGLEKAALGFINTVKTREAARENARAGGEAPA